MKKITRIGVGGPVGSGKTAVIEAVVPVLMKRGVRPLIITNDVVFIDSGGDNLTLTFSPALADFFIYVIDVAAGDKIPRKSGPGVCHSDILVINKEDLAPYVGASLEVMDRDSRRMRGDRPFLFTNCMTGRNIDTLADWIMRDALFDLPAGDGASAEKGADAHA